MSALLVSSRLCRGATAITPSYGSPKVRLRYPRGYPFVKNMRWAVTGVMSAGHAQSLAHLPAKHPSTRDKADLPSVDSGQDCVVLHRQICSTHQRHAEGYTNMQSVTGNKVLIFFIRVHTFPAHIMVFSHQCRAALNANLHSVESDYV